MASDYSEKTRIRAADLIREGKHPSVPGTTTCHRLGCRLPECVAANSVAKKRSKYIRANGGSQMVPVHPVRVHLARLSNLGWSQRQIADAVGMTQNTIHLFVSGRTRRVRAGNAARIFAIHARAPEVTAAGQVIDSTITRRQLQALAAAAYTNGWIAAQLGLSASSGSALGDWQTGRRSRVSLRVARRIDALATQVGLTPGPSLRARLRAERLGWHPPAWYDPGWQLPAVADDELEQAPSHEEELKARFRAEVAELLRCQWTPERIAERLTVSGFDVTVVDVRRERDRLRTSARRGGNYSKAA